MMKFAPLLVLACPALAAHCGPYCDQFFAGEVNTCNGTRPAGTAIYATRQDCLNECGGWWGPALDATGTIVSGNSAACRKYHVDVASRDVVPADQHCAHANPASVELTTSPNSAGPCVNGGATADARCEDYCTNAIRTCGGISLMQQAPSFNGSDPEYREGQSDFDSTAFRSCMAFCATQSKGSIDAQDVSYPLADPGSANNLECRRYHLQVARDGGEGAAATHCPHATYGDDVCGSTCDAFCDLALATCTGGNSQFVDKDDCMTECATYADSEDSDFQTEGDSIQCRFYHLSVAAAADSAGGPDVHCSHIGSDPMGPCGSSAAGLVPSALVVAALAYASM